MCDPGEQKTGGNHQRRAGEGHAGRLLAPEKPAEHEAPDQRRVHGRAASQASSIR
jgi:hypothetical protein